MQISEQESRTLARVLEMLGSGKALAQDVEDYVVGYHVLGNLVATAQGDSERAEMATKLAWAEAFSKAKEGDNKVSDALARAQADIAVQDLRRSEIKTREKMLKLKATRDAVQEAIWGIKFLGRRDGG